MSRCALSAAPRAFYQARTPRKSTAPEKKSPPVGAPLFARRLQHQGLNHEGASFLGAQAWERAIPCCACAPPSACCCWIPCLKLLNAGACSLRRV
eukprot:1330504-Alexandrium_andersonii.AAC.1